MARSVENKETVLTIAGHALHGSGLLRAQRLRPHGSRSLAHCTLMGTVVPGLDQVTVSSWEASSHRLWMVLQLL